MFAMLFGNINPMVEMESMGAVRSFMVLPIVFVIMLLMALVFAAVVCLIVWLCRRGSSDNGLKQTITEQQTKIDDLKRELEEVKRKLEG